MDQYSSTYTKDYVWPYVKKISPRTAGRAESPYGGRACTCGAEPGGYMPPREYVGTLEAENYQWSRLEPMGPLLDAKLYPTKTGPVPENEIMRHDQPNTYLAKLQEKYPYLYNVLQSAPPDDMIRRVNEDRLRTTYQVDYDHIDEHPSAEYDNLLGKAGLSSDCSKTPVMDCRTNVRPPNYSDQGQPQHTTNSSGGSGGLGGSREAGHNKGGGSSRGAARNSVVKGMRSSGGGSEKTDAGGFGSSEGKEGKRAGKIVNDSEASKKKVLPAWITEYQEVIGQTGLDIVEDKMHQHGGKSPGRVMMERAVMQCHTHS